MARGKQFVVVPPHRRRPASVELPPNRRDLIARRARVLAKRRAKLFGREDTGPEPEVDRKAEAADLADALGLAP